MALFAGALVSFAQIVNGVNPSTTNTQSVSWGALLVFLYGAIMLSLAGSFLSLIMIKMCSDLPLAVQQTILSKSPTRTIIPGHVAVGGQISEDVLASHFGQISEDVLASHFLLLETFGMSVSYKRVVRLSNLVLIATCISTFMAFTFWLFLSEAIIIAGLTMIFFGAAAIIVTFAYITAGNGQGWS